MALLIVALLAVFASSQAALFTYGVTKTESDLRRDLFQNYDKLVRPVKDVKTLVPVSVAINPVRIEAVDEEADKLVLKSWLTLFWKDEYLQWDPEEYSGLKSLNIPNSEVWKPDITLYTAVSDEDFIPTTNTRVLVFNESMVLWVPPFTLNSRCNVSEDSTLCVIKFGSWTYSDNEFDIRKYKDGFDLSYFDNTHPSWELVSITSEVQKKFYPCCPQSYSSINFNVTLSKRL